MIVCDKCRGKAIYHLSVDYLRDLGAFQYDLCEKHYNQIAELIQEDRKPDQPKHKAKGKILMRG